MKRNRESALSVGLKKLRELTGLTNQQIASRTGFDYRRVGDWVRGDHVPPAASLKQVLRVLIHAAADEPKTAFPREHANLLDDGETGPWLKWRDAAARAGLPASAGRGATYPRGVGSQAGPRAQEPTTWALYELNQAKYQLMVSLRVEFQVAEIIRALRIVLVHLAGVGEDYCTERELARTQLRQADQERERAAELAAQAQLVLDALDARLHTLDAPVATPVITSHAVMVNVPVGLARVQRILDELKSQLGRLEAEPTVEGMAERLFVQYVDAPMPVAILDADDRFLRTNEPFLKAVGYTVGELAELRLSDLARSWTGGDDHVILPKEGEVLRYQLRRWPVSDCQIAVLADGDHLELGLPSMDWLRTWFDGHGGFSSRKLAVCRVSFDTDSIPDEAWDEAELEMRLARNMFSVVSEGRLVVEVDLATYMVIVDGHTTGVDEFVENLTPALAEIGEGMPYALDAADCGTPCPPSPEELLWRIDASSRWAAVEGRTRPWIVREPVFSGAAPDVPAAEPPHYRPLCDASGRVWRLQVVGLTSPSVFRSVVGQFQQWQDSQFSYLDLDFVVTSDELRGHDWRGELPHLTRNSHVRLMLDDLLDFQSYVLLRRFAATGRAGVQSFDPAVRSRARQLALDVPDANLVPGTPTDVRGIESLLNA